MNRFNFSGLHHAAFATSDMEKTIAYWRDLLGFKIVLGMGNESEKQYAFQISKQMLLFFFEWSEVESVKPKRHGEPVPGPFIFDHLALSLESRSDLERLQDQLVCASFPVTDIIDHGFLNSIYTFDPNGIPLEFSCLVDEVDLDESPVFVDRYPGESIKAGLKPDYSRWPECSEDDDEDRLVIEGKEKKYFSSSISFEEGHRK